MFVRVVNFVLAASYYNTYSRGFISILIQNNAIFFVKVLHYYIKPSRVGFFSNCLKLVKTFVGNYSFLFVFFLRRILLLFPRHFLLCETLLP